MGMKNGLIECKTHGCDIKRMRDALVRIPVYNSELWRWHDHLAYSMGDPSRLSLYEESIHEEQIAL